MATFLLDACNATLYSKEVIRSFQHDGLKEFFLTGSKAKIQPAHAKRIAQQLQRLNAAEQIADMNDPSYRLHPLKGQMAGLWSIRVNGNWRITFRFEDGDAFVVDYQDYH